MNFSIFRKTNFRNFSNFLKVRKENASSVEFQEDMVFEMLGGKIGVKKTILSNLESQQTHENASWEPLARRRERRSCDRTTSTGPRSPRRGRSGGGGR